MEGLSIVDHSHLNEKKNLSVQIRTTDRVFLNKHEEGRFLANICGSCGYVELFVHNPKELWEAYLKNKTL
jgi:ribosomal protein S27AE